MNKNISPVVAWSLICAISLIVLLAMFIQLGQQSWQKTGEKTSISSGDAVVVVDYGNGKTRKFRGPIQENAKAWDLFQQAIAVGGIKVEIADHFVPKIIDGLKDGSDGKHWSLYVNNEKQKFSPFEITVNPGDTVIFRFE